MSTTKTATMTAGSSPLSGRSNKSPPKTSKSITLKLPPTVLGRFPGLPASDSQAETETKTKTKTRPASASPDDSSAASNTAAGAAAAAAAATTADTSTATAPTAPTSSGDNASDGASTPVTAPAPGATTPSGLSDASKRKGIPGPKPGNKRGLGQGVDTTPRPRGKPGPKKKARLDDGTPEGQTRTTTGGGSSNKLGPKANQGAINAGLRALDRTGKPCRKWERKPFQLKSFTGVHWGIPTWRAPKTKAVEELSTEAAENDVPNDDTGSKANNSTSAVESEKSNSGDGDATPMNTNAASSPAPAAAVAA